MWTTEVIRKCFGFPYWGLAFTWFSFSCMICIYLAFTDLSKLYFLGVNQFCMNWLSYRSKTSKLAEDVVMGPEPT